MKKANIFFNHLKSKFNFKYQGFSLVEIMVSLSVIAVIAAVFIPVVTKKITNNNKIALSDIVKMSNSCDDISSCKTNNLTCLLCTTKNSNGQKTCIQAVGTCPAGQVVDSNSCSCIDCVRNCKTCYGHDKCKECKPGYCMDDTRKKCTKITAGNYCNPSSSRTDNIDPCPVGKYCTAKEDDNYEPKECPAGTYRNSTGAKSKAECSQCPAGKYSATGSATCINCEKGTYSATGSAACTECSNSTYCPSESCSSCLPCNIEGCNIYSKTACSCTQCNSGYDLENGKCIKQTCPAGSIYIENNRNRSSCLRCLIESGLDLSHYRDLSVDPPAACFTQCMCTQCSAGSYAPKGATACTECPEKTASSSGSAYCTNCSTINHCSRYSKTDCACTSCSSGYCVAYNGSCITIPTCSRGEYRSGCTCRSCPSNCSTCTSSSKCTSCKSGYSLNNGSCENSSTPEPPTPEPPTPEPPTPEEPSNSDPTCSSSQYLDNGTCKSCSSKYGSGCAACTSSSCTSCQSGYKLFPNDEKIKHHGECGKCPTGCTTSGCSVVIRMSSYYDTNCSACTSGYYVTDGMCMPCVSISPYCLQCTHGTSSPQCTSCGSDSSGQAYVPKNGKCVPCEEVYGPSCHL